MAWKVKAAAAAAGLRKQQHRGAVAAMAKNGGGSSSSPILRSSVTHSVLNCSQPSDPGPQTVINDKIQVWYSKLNF